MFSVLFACTANALRSPMAEAMLKRRARLRLYVDSAGVATRPLDPIAVRVMAEIDIDISGHKPKTFVEMTDTSFDRIVTLSPQAHHLAMEFTRTLSCDVDYWPTVDPSVVEGSSNQILQAYREVRDDLAARIAAAFPEADT